MNVLVFAGAAIVFATLLLAGLAAAQSDPNRFNRLMKPAAERNAPPPIDGIHDGDNEGTYLLQTPLEAFSTLPKSKSGNYVSWNQAIDDNLIAPRNSLREESLPPIVLDLNIVREVKGSMPDVVYPHKQHTQWLDCANCHPAIFIPQKGANQISMASILLGEKCGVCHGKVAFPVSECRRCHSRPKQQAAAN
jgi:c(7)-type cytochrome triheme protein